MKTDPTTKVSDCCGAEVMSNGDSDTSDIKTVKN